MIQESYVELLRLQKAAVIQLKPLCLESRVKEATTVHDVYMAASAERRSLVSTRFLSTQCGSVDAARRLNALTQPAFDAVNLLLAECERELGDVLSQPANPQPPGDPHGTAIDDGSRHD